MTADTPADATGRDLGQAHEAVPSEGHPFEPVAKNTDRELFREDTGEPAGSYYENSVHVTAEGHIGMNVGGRVVVLPIEKWHGLAWLEGGAS